MINYHNLNYNGNKVTFSQGANLMVNATEMAKPFGKRPVDWMNTQQSKDILATLSKVRNLTFEQLVYIKQGSSVNGGGTWFHEDVALMFAQWLSPEFYIWCNDQIKALLTTGKVELSKSTSSVRELPAPTADVTKNDSILTTAQRAIDKEYTFAQVGGMIIWHGKPMRRPLLQAWMYEHGFLCTKDGFSNYPTELALALALMTVVDRRKRGAQTKLKKPKVRITMDGANYFINVLQYGLRGIFPASRTNLPINGIKF